MNLALLGFATIAGFLGLILLTRTSVIVALILVPIITALIGGFASQIGVLALDGIRTVAPVAALMIFAILYFGLMIDMRLFDPVVRKLLAMVRGDPVRLCMVTAALPMLVAFDGDGSTTFLISITALLPLHRRLGLDPLVLPCLVALSAGVMNMLPWGGPTARAMVALGGDADDIFVPVMPAMMAGVMWVFFAAWIIGRQERRRLVNVQVPIPDNFQDSIAPGLGKIFLINASLTLILILLLFHGLYADSNALAPTLLFMGAFAVALPFNRRTLDAQQAQLAAHAPTIVLVTSMILAAGVFTGILSGTGMIKAMASVLADAVPNALVPWLAPLVAVASMPLSLVFTPDAYYFGVLPVLAQTASATGLDPLTVGRASVLGQMTTGFPLSPLTASTFILVGLSQVRLAAHQYFTFKWAFGTTIVMTATAYVTGAL